ncbi:hypothetical protein SAMN04488030_2742 [Aliiroseovarius halocynthiae]|uniref:DUF1674 domain-containing protein n=1 Tax=Aliiroseovarius halocynthiae TaxID=985055 RepID=A0A545SP94_9RHOB|nr:DUF1674 domain-containing protein [Aliiroseovarius halocynthiae]TQV66781.1 DUF1674 domain-containing protein [Aliiroseovarius halocynthiae]SMR82391.1 hypothetical protein SAMN04488030_2742 [Aliiroseovarius halocynthiae]
MSDDSPKVDQSKDAAPQPPKRDLPPAAIRALAEAEERRKKAQDEAKSLPTELGGRDGPEPVRFGDWEKKGIAIDF